MLELYQSHIQSVSISIVMLPQSRAATDQSGNPYNSFAVLQSGMFILFDSPFSWTVPGIRELIKLGRTPSASLVSNSETAVAGDAHEILEDEFQLCSMLHLEDQASAAAEGCEFKFGDPLESNVLDSSNIELIHIPGHTNGATMLYVKNDGFLLAGGSAIGPDAKQASEPPVLKRPALSHDCRESFCQQWRDIVADRDIRGVLPLSGRGLSRAELGRRSFDKAIENIWAGEASDIV